ncbi:MAG: hypothetical protein ACRCTJ_06555, partial [Brevinema sp.]
QAFYIGLTSQKARERMNGHRQSVKNNELEKPVAEHAASHGINFLFYLLNTKRVHTYFYYIHTIFKHI